MSRDAVAEEVKPVKALKRLIVSANRGRSHEVAEEVNPVRPSEGPEGILSRSKEREGPDPRGSWACQLAAAAHPAPLPASLLPSLVPCDTL